MLHIIGFTKSNRRMTLMLQPIDVTESYRCLLKVMGVNYKIQLNICQVSSMSCHFPIPGVVLDCIDS